MLEPILLANSNGTLITDINQTNRGDIEAARPGMYDDLARDKSTFFAEYLRICDDVFLERGFYRPEPINGSELLPWIFHEQQIGLFAAASEAYLRRAYASFGWNEETISNYFSVFSEVLEDLRQNGYTPKDENSFTRLEEVLNGLGKNPIGYLSHKPGEAELGAEIFGHGILIDPNVRTVEERPGSNGGNILVVPTLANVEASDRILALYAA